jgi:hypothetical protein
VGRKNVKPSSGSRLRWENRAGARSGARVPGLEMPWNPGADTNLTLGPPSSGHAGSTRPGQTQKFCERSLKDS